MHLPLSLHVLISATKFFQFTIYTMLQQKPLPDDPFASLTRTCTSTMPHWKTRFRAPRRVRVNRLRMVALLICTVVVLLVRSKIFTDFKFYTEV